MSIQPILRSLGLLLVLTTLAPKIVQSAENPVKKESAEKAEVKAKEELSLSALVEEALQNHPSLSVTQHAAEAAARVPSQVGALPDPVIALNISNLRIDDPSLSSSPMSGVQLAVQQAVPFPGKLGRRRKVSEAGATTARTVNRLQEIAVIREVKVAYWDYTYAHAAETITRQNLSILDTLVNVANSRVAVGQGAQQDVLKAQVALGQLRDLLLIREQQTGTAVERLSIAVGREPGLPLPISPPTTAPPPPPSLELSSLLEELEETNPQLQVRDSIVQRTKASVREARHDLWPDFVFAGAYRFRGTVPGDASDGADMFSISVGLSVPLYAGSKQKQRIAENRQIDLQARAKVQDTRLTVQFEARRLWDELQRLDGQEKLYRQEILPQANMALEASITEYQVAKVGFFSVLDNWRRLFDSEITHERILADRSIRVAELEAVVGRELQ